MISDVINDGFSFNGITYEINSSMVRHSLNKAHSPSSSENTRTSLGLRRPAIISFARCVCILTLRCFKILILIKFAFGVPDYLKPTFIQRV
mgnify:CR=1 FL=1